MRQLLRRLTYLFRHRQFETDLADELAFHRAMKHRELERRGVDPEDVEFRTRRELGSMALANDRARDVWLPVWLQGLGDDVRFGGRLLRSTPLVSAIAVMSLALGIGANVAIFSVIDSLILRPLPSVIDPGRLITLSSGPTNSPEPRWSYAFWEEIERRSHAWGGSLAWSNSRFQLSTGGEAERVDGAFVSGDFFSTLGVLASIGRMLTGADDVRGGPVSGPVAVISNNLWQRRFAGSPQVLGMPLTIDQTRFTIVGVTPPGFFGTVVGRAFDIAVPLGIEPLLRGSQTSLTPPEDRGNQWLTIALRLKPDQSVDSATAVLRGMQPQIRDGAQVPGRLEFLKEPLTLTPITTGNSPLRRVYRRPLLAILFVVALVLLVACANIANLQLARATGRRHELSVRCALGAARWRVARQLLIESLMMAAIGAGAGLALASWGSRWLVAQISTPANRITLDLPLDWRVLAFTTAVAGATPVPFVLVPSQRDGWVSPMDVLKAQGRGVTGDGPAGLSGALVVFQVGLSLVLLMFAGLFIGTFQHLARRPLGFDTGHVLVARVDTAHAAVHPPERLAFFHRLVAAVASAPGVARAAGSFSTPIDFTQSNLFVHVTGTPQVPATSGISSRFNFVTPGWFSTYGTPLHAGRDFDAHDVRGSLPVAIVNESFVRRFLPGGTTIGSAIDLTGGARGEDSFGTMTIIGVVGDAIYSSLREHPQPTMYVPLAQCFFPSPLNFELNISVRPASGLPAALIPTVNSALALVDTSLTIGFRALDAQVRDSFAQERLVAMLAGLFAGLALLLAALGLYGVTAYAVTRRRAEIGVRLALGAGQASIVWVAVARVSFLVGIGVAIGTVASLGLSQCVAALLYGLEPQDPAILASATVMLMIVAALASGWPAWRASRIDPAVVLREP
jgi:putative ABC transport system permease protein